MGHGKLNMKLIAKENVRLSTYQKRKKSLTKKAQEFSILCGVETCVIVYGPKLKCGSAELEIWPSDPAKVTNVIEKYQNKASDLRERKSFNVFDFFALRQKKLDDEFFKLRKANTGAKFSTWDDGINNFSVNQIRALIAKLDTNLEAAKKQMEMIKGKLHQGLIEESTKSRILVGHPRTHVINQPRFDVPITNRQQQQPYMSGLKSFDMMNLPSYNYPSDHFGVTSSRPQQPMSMPALQSLDMNNVPSNYYPFGVTSSSPPLQQQPMSGLKSFDMNVPSYNYPFGGSRDVGLQMQPFNYLNPMITNSMSTMVCKNGSGYTQVDGDISGSSSLSAQTSCFDPTLTPILNNVLCSNPWGVPVCFYGPFMQPTVPSFASQFGDFYPDIADLYGSRNKKQKF